MMGFHKVRENLPSGSYLTTRAGRRSSYVKATVLSIVEGESCIFTPVTVISLKIDNPVAVRFRVEKRTVMNTSSCTMS